MSRRDGRRCSAPRPRRSISAGVERPLTPCRLPAGCGSGLPAETKGVYVLFFLLSGLILVLLVAAGLLYRRHHRGAFCVPPPDPNNNPHLGGECCCRAVDPDLPPPPPPVRGLREGWPPAGDLPLLRFSPLLPPDGKM